MQSSKAITVVLVALVLTGMCGYLLQPSHENKVVTTYAYKGDTTPSVIYTQIDDWLEYNPLTNVTGWVPKDNISIPANMDSQGNIVANQYIRTPTITGYDDSEIDLEGTQLLVTPTTTVRQDRLNPVLQIGNTEYGMTAQGYGSNYPYDTDTKTNPKVVQRSTGEVAEGILVHGGVSAEVIGYKPNDSSTPGFHDYLSTIDIRFIKNVYDSTGDLVASSTSTESQNVVVYPVSWWGLNNVPDGTVFHVPSGMNLYTMDEKLTTSYDRVYTVSLQNVRNTFGEMTTTIQMDCTPIGYTDWIYIANENLYYPAKFNTQIEIWEAEGNTTGYYPDELIFTDSTVTTQKLDRSTPIVSQLSYVDSTKFVNIISGTGYWSNNQVNGTINVLCTPNTVFTFDNGATISCPATLPYQYLLCSLDFHNHVFTCKGVTSFTNTLSYVSNDYQYTLTDSGDIPESVTKLSVMTTTGNSEVYIDSTIVAIDPKGLLWGNPDMALDYFFPEQMTQSTRLLFNGFVKYGDTLTINGIDPPFNIVDGKLEYAYSKSVTPSAYPKISMKLVEPTNTLQSNHALFAIDFIPSSTSKVQTYEREAVFVNNSATLSINTSYGEVTMNIQKSSSEYNIVCHDKDNQEYKGLIISSQYGKDIQLTKSANTIPVVEYFPLKGMAVDFIKKTGTNVFDVSLVFTEARDFKIPLGTLNTDTKQITYTQEIFDQESNKPQIISKTIESKTGFVISGTGNWYWQAGLYSISTETKDMVGLDITSGVFGLSISGAALLMVFFTILGTAGYIRITGSEFRIMDWLVLIAVDAILITVAVF